jgi:hypothetical protein
LNSNRTWKSLLAALFAALLMVFLMAVCALQPTVVSAGPQTLSLRLRSSLQPNYRVEASAGPVGRLSLSIFHQLLEDSGLSPEAQATQKAALEEMMNAPVPTATGSGPSGSASATPTAVPPSATALPPTATATMPSGEPTTAASPTKTLEPSKTTEPTKTPTPTKTQLLSASDTLPPQIFPGTLDPAPGPIPGCKLTVSANGWRVYDPPVSSGMDDVDLWYRVTDGVQTYRNWTKATNMTKVSGGWVGEAWDATYDGSFSLEIKPGWVGDKLNNGPADFMVELKIRAKDNAHNTTYYYVLDKYTISHSCDDPAPSATPTPSRTPTVTATPSPTSTPTITATPGPTTEPVETET